MFISSLTSPTSTGCFSFIRRMEDYVPVWITIDSSKPCEFNHRYYNKHTASYTSRKEASGRLSSLQNGALWISGNTLWLSQCPICYTVLSLWLLFTRLLLTKSQVLWEDQKKCQIHLTPVSFLGYILSPRDVWSSTSCSTGLSDRTSAVPGVLEIVQKFLKFQCVCHFSKGLPAGSLGHQLPKRLSSSSRISISIIYHPNYSVCDQGGWLWSGNWSQALSKERETTQTSARTIHHLREITRLAIGKSLLLS